jgi:hypothetical protein
LDSGCEGESEPSNDSLFGESECAHGQTSSISSGSIFGGGISLNTDKHDFMRGFRPLSIISTGSSTDNQEDTFINVAKYATKAKAEMCLQGEGESASESVAVAEEKGGRY